ncbi:DUF4402 domain-containing protein [uncultured Desulfobacter sp.]|uniref:DUF4402 domain-containing protein n=1 Tax=uncultured Desulfobacter sp. TaxID=240139 RepID=UPI002AABA4AB|nr:DUF4402 domain-containing protein [uncultured Desulfobacter sp.]
MQVVFPKFIFSLMILFSAMFPTMDITCAIAADITFARNISFGTIIADLHGEIIEIDALNGSGKPISYTSGGAYIDGGYCGLIRIFSDKPGQTIQITYPVSVMLKASDGSKMTLSGISARSKTVAVSTAVGDIDFNFGGLLHLKGGQSSQSYSGNITISINIIDP